MLSGSNLPASRAVNPSLTYLSQKSKLSAHILILGDMKSVLTQEEFIEYTIAHRFSPDGSGSRLSLF